jgi:predicted TIM-barrel fold metal-dependent hydrolase
LIQLFLWIMGQARAPAADTELDGLQRGQRPQSVSNSRNASQDAVADAVATYYARDAAASVDGDGHSRVKTAIFEAAGMGDKAMSLDPPTRKESREAAKAAMASTFDIGRYLRWFALFTRYRQSLALQLQARYEADGFSSVLLCPAMIDYDSWIGERVTRSPLRSQIYVMGAIATAPNGPAVHGYVAYDPLRQVKFDRNIERRENPLGLVRQALTEYGFLGVKLYPPMGFRASGNEEKPAQRYPEPVDALLHGRVGADLNLALEKLYDLCSELNAPILAHAGASNGAGPGYEQRADPAYWLPVFAKYPRLHVCLAHFGGFDTVSAARAGRPLPQSSWDWVFGDYIRENPQAPVYADISYFAEIVGKTDVELKAYADLLRSFLAANDPECRHLVFGSDWIMLGLDASDRSYAARVHHFFKSHCGFDDAMLRRLFFENGVRYLGLNPGGGSRQRLQEFYRENGMSLARLPDFSNVGD